MDKQSIANRTTDFTEYDPVNYLDSPEAICGYLDEALIDADADLSHFLEALGEVARAKGMTQRSDDTELGRASLYKSPSGEVDPSISTVATVLSALGLRFTVAKQE